MLGLGVEINVYFYYVYLLFELIFLHFFNAMMLRKVYDNFSFIVYYHQIRF